MESVIKSINKGFGNCLFFNREPKTIESVITDKVNDPDLNVLPEKPESITVVTIDDLHDKLCLSYNDKKVEGTITWRPSVNGRHYVFTNFE